MASDGPGTLDAMDSRAHHPITPRQAAATLRRVADRAFRRRLDADAWPGAYLTHAARVYELAAVMVEDAVDEDDVRRALEVLRLHEASAGAFLLRWLHMTAADFIEAALLGGREEAGGIPPAGMRS